MRLNSSVTLAGLAGLWVAGSVEAAVVGPMYPPPGGVSLTQSGPGDAFGGATWTYTNFDTNDINAGLYWGKSSTFSIALSLNGGGYLGNEVMTFAGTVGNVATWTGATSIFVSNGFGYSENVVNTRFKLTTTDLINAPINFTSPASVDPGFPSAADAVIDVAGHFQALRQFEIFWAGTWQPAYSVYNSLNTDPSRTTQKSFGAGFYVVPEPGAIGLIAIGGAALLLRRAQRGRPTGR